MWSGVGVGWDGMEVGWEWEWDRDGMGVGMGQRWGSGRMAWYRGSGMGLPDSVPSLRHPGAAGIGCAGQREGSSSFSELKNQGTAAGRSDSKLGRASPG